MLKHAVFAVLLVMAGDLSAQEIAVSAKDVESGAADAKFAAIAQQAAAAGKPLVVNAPAEWHVKLAAKFKAAGVTDVKFNDSFFETAVVRIEDKPMPPKLIESPKPAEPLKQVPKSTSVKPSTMSKPVEVPEPSKALQTSEPVEAAPTEAAPTEAAPTEAAPTEAAPTEAAPTEAAPESEPVASSPVDIAPLPKSTPAESMKLSADTDANAAVRQRVLNHLNEGRPIDGELTSSQLERSDVIYVDGPIVAVARRDRARSQLYWLSDELNLQRVELMPLGNKRYQVGDTLSPAVLLRSEVASQEITAAVPADGDAERAKLEKAYGEGRTILRSLHVAQLRQGDVIYVGKKAAVVLHRDGDEVVHYWLDGNVDLDQRGLQKESANKYKVLSDRVK